MCKTVRKSPIHGVNPWPKGHPTFAGTLRGYVSHMDHLGTAIMRGIALGLDLEKTFFEGEYRGEPYWVMRVIHYPPLPELSQSEGSVPSAAARVLAGATSALAAFAPLVAAGHVAKHAVALFSRSLQRPTGDKRSVFLALRNSVLYSLFCCAAGAQPGRMQGRRCRGQSS